MNSLYLGRVFASAFALGISLSTDGAEYTFTKIVDSNELVLNSPDALGLPALSNRNLAFGVTGQGVYT